MLLCLVIAYIYQGGGEAGSHGMIFRLTWSRSKYSFFSVAHMVAHPAHMVTLVHFSKKYHALTEKSVVLELIKGKLKNIAIRVLPYLL